MQLQTFNLFANDVEDPDCTNKIIYLLAAWEPWDIFREKWKYAANNWGYKWPITYRPTHSKRSKD